MSTETCIEHCNKLLRGELSALETYEQAIEKLAEKPEAATLELIRKDHAYSVEKLQSNIQAMGGTPETSSGAWGVFAKAVEGAATIFGPETAVKALLEGEKHGQSAYEDAIESKDVLPECKEMILSELLPKQQAHIAKLEALNFS